MCSLDHSLRERLLFAKKIAMEFCEFEVLNEVYLQKLFAQMGCKSRDESNDTK